MCDHNSSYCAGRHQFERTLQGGAVLDCAKKGIDMDIIGQIWTGRAGLARTYWLYGVAASFVWGIALSMVTPGRLVAMAAVAALLAYFVIVNVGIWRSASQYDGPKVWAVLAKMAVAAIPALIIVGTIAAVVVPMSSTQEQERAIKSPETERWRSGIPLD